MVWRIVSFDSGRAGLQIVGSRSGTEMPHPPLTRPSFCSSASSKTWTEKLPSTGVLHRWEKLKPCGSAGGVAFTGGQTCQPRRPCSCGHAHAPLPTMGKGQHGGAPPVSLDAGSCLQLIGQHLQLRQGHNGSLRQVVYCVESTPRPPLAFVVHRRAHRGVKTESVWRQGSRPCIHSQHARIRATSSLVSWLFATGITWSHGAAARLRDYHHRRLCCCRSAAPGAGLSLNARYRLEVRLAVMWSGPWLLFNCNGSATTSGGGKYVGVWLACCTERDLGFEIESLEQERVQQLHARGRGRLSKGR